MKKLNVTLVGNSPLIMHSPKCVNPLHPISLEMKKYTSKRKKTDEDYLKISDLEWESGVYWDDKIGLYIPNECIKATIQNGAKANRKGTDIAKFLQIMTLMAPLDIFEEQNYEVLRTDNRYRDVRSVCIKKSRVNRTRPRFNTWKTTFEIVYDENMMDLNTIIDALEYAGSYVGLCEMRDRGYGRFSANIVEVA
nr:MAG TPA: hypothetical protein [Caudoviricetes sp.]